MHRTLQNVAEKDDLETRLKNIESKNIIVHLPVDLTSLQNYENTFNPQSFNLQSQNLVANNVFNPCGITEKQENKNTMRFGSENITFEKRITPLVSHNYYVNDNFSKNKCPLHCWHCSREILWTPCGLPISMKDDKFVVKGFFCTLNCALSFNYYSTAGETKIQEREALLRLFYKRYIDSNQLTYAPPREALKIFGGTLTFEEFHAHNHHVEISDAPIVPLHCFLQENIALDID